MAYTQPFRLSTQLKDANGFKDTFQLFGMASTTATIADIPIAVRNILGKFYFFVGAEFLPVEFTLLIPTPSNVAGPATPGTEIENVCLWKMGGPPGKPTPIPIDVPGIYEPAFPGGRIDPAESGIASLNQMLINGITACHFTDRNGQAFVSYKEAIVTHHHRKGRATRP